MCSTINTDINQPILQKSLNTDDSDIDIDINFAKLHIDDAANQSHPKNDKGFNPFMLMLPTQTDSNLVTVTTTSKLFSSKIIPITSTFVAELEAYTTKQNISIEMNEKLKKITVERNNCTKSIKSERKNLKKARFCNNEKWQLVIEGRIGKLEKRRKQLQSSLGKAKQMIASDSVKLRKRRANKLTKLISKKRVSV
jgi:hypothetical protein